MRVLIVIAIVLPLSLLACKKKEPQRPSQPTAAAPGVSAVPGAAAVAPAIVPAPAAPAAYKPRYAQRMFEVALRFHLLGKTADKGNWGYATHQAVELYETFKSDLPNVLPATNLPAGVDIKKLRADYTEGQLAALVAAARKQDKGAFEKAYAEAGAGCNTCHGQVGKSFVVIKAKPGTTFEELLALEAGK